MKRANRGTSKRDLYVTSSSACSGLDLMPGDLMLSLRYTASSGCVAVYERGSVCLRGSLPELFLREGFPLHLPKRVQCLFFQLAFRLGGKVPAMRKCG